MIFSVVWFGQIRIVWIWDEDYYSTQRKKKHNYNVISKIMYKEDNSE